MQATTSTAMRNVLPGSRQAATRITWCGRPTSKPRFAIASAVSGVRLLGVGSSTPQTVVTNDDLAQLVDTNDEWISTRTGIRRRHILAAGETLGSHAVQAAKRALDMAGIRAEDLDMVLFSTSSPDDVFGSACQVQSELGASRAVAFDLTAACSGFVIGMVTGSQFIRTGTYRNVLVIGGDALSRFIDWRDRSTCILFGDGCGALVLSAGAEGEPCSLLGMDMHSDGRGQRHLNCLYSGPGMKPLQEDSVASSSGSYANMHMAGADVFKFAVRAVPTVIEAALAKANMTREQVDWLVMHQANQRILDAAAQRLGLSADRVISNLAEYGNTSAASIPLALDEAVRGGRIQKGDVVAMAGFGAGLTWAGAIVRWG